MDSQWQAGLLGKQMWHATPLRSALLSEGSHTVLEKTCTAQGWQALSPMHFVSPMFEERVWASHSLSLPAPKHSKQAAHSAAPKLSAITVMDCMQPWCWLAMAQQHHSQAAALTACHNALGGAQAYPCQLAAVSQPLQLPANPLQFYAAVPQDTLASSPMALLLSSKRFPSVARSAHTCSCSACSPRPFSMIRWRFRGRLRFVCSRAACSV